MLLRASCIFVVFATVYGNGKPNEPSQANKGPEGIQGQNGPDSQPSLVDKFLKNAKNAKPNGSPTGSEKELSKKIEPIAGRNTHQQHLQNNFAVPPPIIGRPHVQELPPMPNNFLAPPMNNPIQMSQIGTFPALVHNKPINNFGNQFGGSSFGNNNHYTGGIRSNFGQGLNAWSAGGQPNRNSIMDEGICIYEGRTLRQGDKWTQRGICGVFVCGPNRFRILTTSCPPLRYQEGSECEVTDQDLAYEFPDCCPKLECSTKARNFTQGPNGMEKKAASNFNRYLYNN